VTAPTPITAAKQRHRLADIAARTGIPLTAAAGTVTVACPMPAHGHPDRTPSMRLYLDDDRYYCFGCHTHGDVIQWVQDAHQTTITDAIATLTTGAPIRNHWAGHTVGPAAHRPAPAGGVERPDPARTPTGPLLAALDTAWAHYSRPAPHRAAVTYPAHRGLDIAPLERRNRRPEAGYAGSDPTALHRALLAQGFTADALVDAGLALRRTDRPGLVDTYRHRLLTAVRDDQHRVVGLVGRNLGPPDRPKYINPPTTAVYDKAINLYQPLPAPTAPDGHIVVVEGTLDAFAVATAALRLGIAGRVCPVTQSGRELSDHQVDVVAAMDPSPPVLMFDGDPAGRDSTERYLKAFAARGHRAFAVTLPQAEDPASLLAGRGWRDLADLLRDVAPRRRPAPGSDLPAMAPELVP